MAEDQSVIEVEDKETKSKDALRKFLDPAYPLLSRFRDACPGTYKHSQTLASLTEGAAMAFGSRCY